MALNVVSLFCSLLENIEGVSEQVPGVLSLLLAELQAADAPDYVVMLLQGVLMCLWYDLGQTVTVLEQQNATESFSETVDPDGVDSIVGGARLIMQLLQAGEVGSSEAKRLVT